MIRLPSISKICSKPARSVSSRVRADRRTSSVVKAINAENLTLPSGTAKIGDTQYTVRTNALPTSIQDLNNIPVKFANRATVFIKDVGQVHDGWLVQQNVVRTDGDRSILLSIIKNGNASTLTVVNAVKEALQVARKAAPAGMQIKELFDQSVFVTASIQGLLREGAIAAVLTALMIVLFLGSWRFETCHFSYNARASLG
jgi:multidrug efflux pump subunit AcrB